MNCRFAILALLLALPLVEAQQPGGAVGDQQQYAYRELSAISGVITASTMEVWFTSPVEAYSSSDRTYIGFNVAGPDIPTGGLATFTASTITANGCTVGAWSTVSETLAAGTGATSYAQVNFTSSDCSGVAEMLISAGAVPVTLGRFRFAFNIHVPQTSFTNALSGTIGVQQVGGWNVSVSQSGAWTIADDAGGWAVHQDPLSGNLTLQGIPDTQQELQAIADALNLLRNLTVDILDDTTNDGQLTVPTSSINATTIIENATFNSNTTIPDEFKIRTSENAYQGLGDKGLLFLAWFCIMVYCLTREKPKVYAAGACLLGIGATVFLNFAVTQVLCMVVLALAVWVEAIGRDRLYTRLFTGSKNSENRM